MMTTNRWAIRCTDCLSVGFVDVIPGPMTCASCGGRIETMGRVGMKNLYRENLVSVCDERCTSARGATCDCHCGGENHGTHRMVVVRTDLGPVPVATMPDPEASKARAEEFREAYSALDEALEPLREERKRWMSATRFAAWLMGTKALLAARKARVHKSRMANMAKAIKALTGE